MGLLTGFKCACFFIQAVTYRAPQQIVSCITSKKPAGAPLRGQPRYVWNAAHFCCLFFFGCPSKTHEIAPLRFIKLKKMLVSGLKGRIGSRHYIILYVWHVYGNRTHCCCWTRRVRVRNTLPGPPHRVMVSLYHVHQRRKGLQEGKNRWQRIWYKYCTGTSVRVALVLYT